MIQTLLNRGVAVYYDPQKSLPTSIVLGAPVWLGGSQVQFEVTGPPDTVLEVLRSTDLVDWTHLDYLTNTSGTATFTDSTATADRRFYRARTP